MAVHTNLFSSLYRWAHRQDENFVTDAFAYILSHLLIHEWDHAHDLIHFLCFDSKPVSEHCCGTEIAVTTQVTFEVGRPDLLIESEKLWVLIEFKKESGLGPSQVQRYLELIKTHAPPQCKTQLVLLTVYQESIPTREAEHVHRVRWDQIADWLAARQWMSATSSFLVREFVDFLSEQIMTVDRVDWQYTTGTRALCNLRDMLGKALEIAQVPIATRSAGWEYQGYYLDQSKFWVGFSFVRPELIVFEFLSPRKPHHKGEFEAHGGTIVNGKCLFVLDLSAESVHFFALSKQRQLDCLIAFVRDSHKNALCCIDGVESQAALPSTAGITQGDAELEPGSTP